MKIVVFSLDIMFQQIFIGKKYRAILDETDMKDVFVHYEMTNKIMHDHIEPAILEKTIEYV